MHNHNPASIPCKPTNLKFWTPAHYKLFKREAAPPPRSKAATSNLPSTVQSRASNPTVGGDIACPYLPEISIRRMCGFVVVPPPRVVLPAWSEASPAIPPQAKGGARKTGNHHHLLLDVTSPITDDVTCTSTPSLLSSTSTSPAHVNAPPMRPPPRHHPVSSHVTLCTHYAPKWRHAHVIPEKHESAESARKSQIL